MSSQQWGNGRGAQENSPKPEICKVGHQRQWLKICVGDSKEMRDKERQGQNSEARQELEGRWQKRSEKRSESKGWSRKGKHQGNKEEKVPRRREQCSREWGLSWNLLLQEVSYKAVSSM